MFSFLLDMIAPLLERVNAFMQLIDESLFYFYEPLFIDAFIKICIHL